jgi:hypothetical protein
MHHTSSAKFAFLRHDFRFIACSYVNGSDGVYKVFAYEVCIERVPETSGVNNNGYQQCSHLLSTGPQMMMMMMMMVIEQTEISTTTSSNITFETKLILTADIYPTG